MFMPWSEELVIGIQQVDEQHRWLVDLTNQLHDAVMKREAGHAIIGHILEGLMDYTMNHFIMEEALFQRYGYPEQVAHRAEHNAFTAKIAGLMERHENGAAVDAEALEFLKEWLIHHIMKVDKAYAPFLLKQGVS